MKNIPFVPHQDEFDWLANYIDKKKNDLYSLIFGYQLVDGYLRLLIKKKSDAKTADVRGMEKLIKKFRELYPEHTDLTIRLFNWKEKRDSINHSLLFSSKFSNAEQLDDFISNTEKEGCNLFFKLKSVLGEIK